MVKQMTSIARTRALGYLKAGWIITKLAKELGRHKSVIFRLAKKAREMGEERAMVRSPVGGRRNLTSLADIKMMIRMVQKMPSSPLRVSRGSGGGEIQCQEDPGNP